MGGGGGGGGGVAAKGVPALATEGNGKGKNAVDANRIRATKKTVNTAILPKRNWSQLFPRTSKSTNKMRVTRGCGELGMDIAHIGVFWSSYDDRPAGDFKMHYRER